jgi:hypothetical protein
MPPLLILTFLAQAFCVIHAVRNRNNQWIWIILMVPGLGAAAYALSHVVPDLFGSYGVRSASQRVLKAIDPERDRRKLSKNLDRADTIENRRHLAGESLELKDFARAEALFSECLSGIYERDPDLMLGLAQAQFGLEKYATCKQTLDDLIAFNRDYKNAIGHLLFARTLESLNETEKAEREYRVVKDNFPGEEARLRYAEMLIRLGRAERARPLLEEVVKRVQVSPAHYQKSQSAWLTKANAALKTLS